VLRGLIGPDTHHGPQAQATERNLVLTRAMYPLAER